MKKLKIIIISVVILAVLAGAGLMIHQHIEMNNKSIFALVVDGTPKQIIKKIKSGVDVNQIEKGVTPLTLAAVTQKDPKVFKALIEAGADVNFKALRGATALMLASGIQENPEIVKMLIVAGSNVNDKSNEEQTPLMFASEMNPNPEIIKILVEAGADINYKTTEGKTVLLSAVLNNKNPEVAAEIVKSGVIVDELSLMIAIANGADVEAIKVMLNSKVNVNHRDKQDLTPLILSISEAFNTDVIKALVESGADVNAIYKDGLTPLMIATKRIDEPMAVQLIRDNKMDITDPKFDDIRSSIEQEQKTLEAINLSIVELLVNNGANVNAKDVDGKTALVHAKETQKGTKVSDYLEKLTAK